MPERTADRRARPDEPTIRETAGLDVVARLRKDGFALVPDLATRADAAAARVALTRASARLAQPGPAVWRNPRGTCQVAWASRLVPGLAEHPIRAAARALASEIIGGRVVERFDYALVTPPGGPGARWHRDHESFVLSGLKRRVHVWVALEDVDLSNGCLSYVRRGCDADDPDEAAVPCPASAGSALVHDEDTLHRSGDNRSENPRWAWILQFAAPGPAHMALLAADRARAGLILRPTRRRLAQADDRASAAAVGP
jgi:phytanoyl-CoA hydroxylase